MECTTPTSNKLTPKLCSLTSNENIKRNNVNIDALLTRRLIMIPQEKIKSIDYLFNRIISERVRGSGEPKYALLLGAGCSVSSQIASANDVIHLLQSIAFLREEPTKTNSTPFLELEYGKLIPFLEKWYENNSNNQEFLSFVDMHQNNIRKQIDTEFNDFGEYYDEVFHGILQREHKNYQKYSEEEKEQIRRNYIDQYKKNIAVDREYSYWFAQYSTASEDIHSFLTELMNNKNPSEAYIFLADLFINRVFSIAFTTNFDNLLGEAISLLGVRSKEILFAANGIDDTLSKTSPNIIKLHGDYMYNNTKNLSAETRKLSEPLQRQLENVLSKCGMIVIGYAGADNSIMYLLESLSEKYSFPIFWCELEDKIKNDTVHWRARDYVINSANAFFIPMENFDSIIEILRRNYLYYSKLRKDIRSERGEKEASLLYNEEYLTRALNRIKTIIDKVIEQNKKISTEVNPIPPPDVSSLLNIRDKSQRVSGE